LIGSLKIKSGLCSYKTWIEVSSRQWMSGWAR
jgi:hypothetical protein